MTKFKYNYYDRHDPDVTKYQLYRKRVGGTKFRFWDFQANPGFWSESTYSRPPKMRKISEAKANRMLAKYKEQSEKSRI